jgi:uncharacterized protein YraI
VGHLIAAATFAFALSQSTAAPAQSFSVTVTVAVNLRLGPATDYPAIIVIPAFSPVVVLGCLADGQWCNVSWDAYQGWVYAAYLNPVRNGPPAIPPGHLPAPGECRYWVPNVPPGHQPPPFPCHRFP